jgi:xanthine dehydrogenase D subunit
VRAGSPRGWRVAPADRSLERARVGAPAPRPDGPAKVAGTFPYAGDLRIAGMLHARTLRSPHPYARIRALDVTAARRIPGVAAVVTARDVPGRPCYGLIRVDQPVFARTVVRYRGEPVAAVAAADARTAARALAAIEVDYEPLPPLVDSVLAAVPSTPPIHPDGNVIREITVRHGDPAARGDVEVADAYVVGMQDQAFLACEAALAVPAADGGVDVALATQWLHSDREQMAACLGLPEEKVRLTLAGVGGAFGGREDVTLQIHGALLALAAGAPVRIAYDRVESFHGHPHRHPARMWFRHIATSDGRLVAVRARIVMDGGAYASSSPAVLTNAVTHAAGPYRVPNAYLDGVVVRTNNPPCGAMRGFGVPQVTIAHEAQMDRLADRLGMDRVALRRINALGPGDILPTGQVVPDPLPVRELIDLVAAAPLPPPVTAATPVTSLPGGRMAAADPARVRRGVGYGVGYKNLLFSEGSDDSSTARVVLELGPDGVPRVLVHSACAEVGQGFVTIAGQIARTELGVADVVLAPADTSVGSAGSTSASRQTWMSGGAVRAACVTVVDRLLARVAAGLGLPAEAVAAPRRLLSLAGGSIVGPEAGVSVTLAEALAAGPVEATETFHHRRTYPLDAFGQGDAHVAFAAAAHRAVVDVDLDTGLVRVVAMTLAQDVGRVLNPVALRGQVEGGTAQGLGLALMEELVVTDGVIANPTFHDYLLPTAADVPPLEFVAVELPQGGAPYGVKGVGEAPTGTATPAIVAAVRDAVGRDLRRVPIRPADLVQ